MTDDELLQVYLMGVAAGVASATFTAFPDTPIVTLQRSAARFVTAMDRDPAARHEILTNVRRVLAGRPGPGITVLKGTQ